MKNLIPSSLSYNALVWFFPLLIFSYIPVIQLGTYRGFHIDASLLYGALFFTVLVNVVVVWRNRLTLWHSPSWRLLLLFTVYVWLSILWSVNPIRGSVTAGFFTLLFALFSVILCHEERLQRDRKKIYKLLFIAFVIVWAWALWQIVADTIGAPSSLSLLPAMYSGDVFGIARPTAFALEPQFFGNLLLLPFLYSFDKLLRGNKDLIIRAVFFMSAYLLLLTLSRGALLAATVGFLTLCIIRRTSKAAIVSSVAIGLLAIVIAFITTYTVAGLRNDSITASDASSRVINQLSLGAVSLPKEKQQNGSASQNKSASMTEQTNTGYVASSTDSRLSMGKRALDIWLDSPQTTLFGVGLGGFGASLNAAHPEFAVGSVVNNFYLELLAEIGIIGVALLGGFMAYTLIVSFTTRQYLFFALILAFGVQWWFFSGTANTIHIWVIFGLAAAYSTRSNGKTQLRDTSSLLQ